VQQGGVAVECDMVSLLEGVHETELASKWADIEVHRMEFDVVSESMLSKLAVCATRGKVLGARGEGTRESEDSTRANGMDNSGEVQSLLITNVEEVQWLAGELQLGLWVVGFLTRAKTTCIGEVVFLFLVI